MNVYPSPSVKLFLAPFTTEKIQAYATVHRWTQNGLGNMMQKNVTKLL